MNNRDPNSTQDRPLVTFAIIAFNQEAYIREAIEGALSQSYSPLEIIISDDCSSDRTYQIICEMAESYQGDHIVRTHQPKQNLGVGEHVNRIGELANGEFVLLAGGDDISDSTRTSRLVDCWLDSGRQACSVYSNMSIIDGQGNETKPLYNTQGKGVHARSLEDILERETAGLYGCTQGVDRRVFSQFQPMPKEVLHEDEVLPFRALLLGRVEYVDEPLVQYRRHDSNVWGGGFEVDSLAAAKRLTKKRLGQQLGRLRSWCRDLKDAPNRTPELDSFIPRFEQLLLFKEQEVIMNQRNIFSALATTAKNVLCGKGCRQSWAILRRSHLFPLWITFRSKVTGSVSE